ncbi:MAG: hypothetical protein JXO48_04025 [Deltaproteobacteria bacterium]|nr:hypothetical protein [Deltaproteobacteria bacterium]
MNTTVEERKSGGVLQELIDTPFLKDIVRNQLNTMNSEGGREIVRTFLWQDTEVMLNVLAALPKLVNCGAGAAAELGKQIHEKFPPALLKEFLRSIGEEIDTDVLRECVSTYGAILRDLWEASPEIRGALAEHYAVFLKALPELKKIGGDVAVDMGPRLIGGGITVAARYINALHERDPGLVGKCVAGVFESIDQEEMRSALQVLVNAFLDQKPAVLSMVFGIIRGRIMTRFRRRS